MAVAVAKKAKVPACTRSLLQVLPCGQAVMLVSIVRRMLDVEYALELGSKYPVGLVQKSVVGAWRCSQEVKQFRHR